MLWFFKSFFPVVWIFFIVYWRIKAANTKTNQRVEPAASGILRTLTFLIVIVLQYELPPLESESKSISPSTDDVASRIAALRAKPIQQKSKPKHFHFEESEPLKLISQGGSR